MKKLLSTALLLFFGIAMLSAQEVQPQANRPVRFTPAYRISAAGNAMGRVNSQLQMFYPMQIEYQRSIDELYYWGVIGQFASRRDELVAGLTYSDDNDQQMAVALGVVGVDIPIRSNRIRLQIEAGVGVGYHFMKYSDVYPNRAVGYVHFSHWWVIRASDLLSLKFAPLIPNITFAPYDAGAAYSHYPNMFGLCAFGIEFNFK